MNFATAWVTTAPSSTRARANQLPLAVRVGDHSAPGHHSCDEGVVIDCRMLDRIEVDFTTGLVRCGSGVTWKQTRAAAETMSTYSDMVSYPNFLSADDTSHRCRCLRSCRVRPAGRGQEPLRPRKRISDQRQHPAQRMIKEPRASGRYWSCRPGRRQVTVVDPAGRALRSRLRPGRLGTPARAAGRSAVDVVSEGNPVAHACQIEGGAAVGADGDHARAEVVEDWPELFGAVLCRR